MNMHLWSACSPNAADLCLNTPLFHAAKRSVWRKNFISKNSTSTLATTMLCFGLLLDGLVLSKLAANAT